MKSNKNYGVYSDKVVSSPRSSMPRYSKIISKLKRKEKISQNEIKQLILFSEGYDLKGIEERTLSSDFFNEKGIDYSIGIIKRFKDEFFWKKYFTPLHKYHKEAKKFLDNQNE
jgi:hypothetical protein